MSRDALHTASAILNVDVAVARQLLAPSNFSDTTLPIPTSQQPPLATHNGLTRVATKTHSNNPTPPNHSNDINPKPSYASALNPVTVLNPNTTLRLQKSFVDFVTSSNASSIFVKLTKLHRGEPVVYFFAAKIQKMAKLFKLSLVNKFSCGRPPMDVIQFFFL